MDKYRIYKEGSDTFIERVAFPRFRGRITFGGVASDLEDVTFIDDCADVMLAARIMREAGEYIIEHSKHT
jgi:hypothetical protein